MYTIKYCVSSAQFYVAEKLKCGAAIHYVVKTQGKMSNNTSFRAWTPQSTGRPQTTTGRPQMTTGRPQTSSQGNWRQTNANDFPILVTSVKNTSSVPSTPSLAARLAIAIKNDEEQILLKKQLDNKEKEKQKDDNYIHVLPMSQYGRVKYLAEKRIKEEKKKEAEAYEHEYQWQISREISRDVFESEHAYSNRLSTHHEEHLYDNNEDSEE